MNLSAEELWEFYRRCGRLRMRFQTMAAQSLPPAKLVEHCKALGLPVDRELYQADEGELAYALDLAVYAAPPGRSRAIDRIAKQYAGREGEESALVLNALSRSWLSLFRVLGPHPEAGLLLEDLVLGGEVWVLDEALAEHAAPETVLGIRLGRVCGFAITCGVVAVLDPAMAAEVQREVGDDRDLAEELLGNLRFVRGLWLLGLGYRPE
jgi:hypothetical protein